jgi:hypothetical protein
MVRTLAVLLLPAVLAASPLAAQRPRVSPHPDSARLFTDDIPRFWAVFDRATEATLPDLLQRDYLDRGTPGLRGFVPHRIRSAADLARTVGARRDRYAEVREATLAASSAERAFRAPFYALEYLYPDAVFPDVYLVIGRFSSGGTATDEGLVIGAEMLRGRDAARGLVAHELIHFQQRASGQYAAAEAAPSLLALALLEGSASFLAELTSGVRGEAAAHEYGRAHERELWEEFRRVMRGTDTQGWFQGDPPGPRPADLGYFVGYRIAEAYYDRAPDKRQAIREILTTRDFEAFLARSGYRP